MKIGFDISQTCQEKSGTGFFADQVIRNLAEVDKENEYTLLPWFYDYRPSTVEKATKITQKNFKVKKMDNFSDTNPEIRELDIVHSNNFGFPHGIAAKKVVTLYDVSFMDCPEYTTEANRIVCYKGTLDAMLFADKIISISQYTKERLLHFFPFVNEKKVEVVYCGNRDILLKEKEDERLINRFKLSKSEYYLAVGTIEPRKNYKTLLKAYKIYRDRNKQYKKLCIAGGYGWMQENFMDDIIDLGLADDVIVTGYVSELELSNLYRYCFAFVYPTWYEGFGLPVLEAMNFGKPVIASDVTSIPEIVGDSGLLIRPDSFEEIADYMKKIEDDNILYQELAMKGFNRAQKFSWINSAKQIRDIYNSIV